MACRFPEAGDPAELLEVVVTGRRAFRRLPPVRLDAAEYSGDEHAGTDPADPGPAGPARPAAGTFRAGLIEGWRFDRAAFGVTQPAYRAADPAHWLALETAARALADGGFPGGQGLTRDRTGVIIGNTLTGEVSRATAMRSRWPYVRRVLSSALVAGEVPPGRRADVMENAAAGFCAPFPVIGSGSLAGSLPGAIADRICGHFGFRGGGHAVDAAHSSSLLAVTAACSALAAGDLDAAVAGGVDISLDPFELAGLAATGVLASGEMRVFDSRPTGFWPGEGCGLVVLMRAADARASGVPTYAQIAGWGVASAGNPALTRPGSASLLLALRRAYHRAGIDPADIQLIEGDGTGTASGDLAELTSLADIRQGAPGLAALGSVKASIGHTKAAAGSASLLKATLAISAGVIPPATGCIRPHPLIASQDARLRAPRAAESWPERARLAGVSSVGPGGTSVHVILRRTRDGRRRKPPAAPGLRPGETAAPAPRSRGADGRGDGPGGAAPPPPIPIMPGGTPRTEVFSFSAADRTALAAELDRIADLAPWLSDGELHDLACQEGRRRGTPGPVRAALVASGQDRLAQLAREAAALLSGLRPGRLHASPGMYLADGGRGRVTLLFPGEGSTAGGCGGPSPRGSGTSPAFTAEAGSYDPALQPGIVAASLAGLRLLDELGISPVAAVGHGLGEITGLVWAGSLSEPEAARLVAQRAALLAAPSPQRTAMVCVDADGQTAQLLCAGTGLSVSAYNGPRCHVLAGPAADVREVMRRLAEDGIPARLLDSPHGFYSPAMADLAAPLRGMLREFSFQPPSRRLISTITGADLTAGDDIPSMVCAQLTSPVRFAGPLMLAAGDSDLLIETGPGHALTRIAADCCEVPAASLGAGRGDEEAVAQAAAGLFASGAAASLRPLFAARPARPVDIWRERVFIPSPCGAPAGGASILPPSPPAADPRSGTPGVPGAATPGTPAPSGMPTSAGGDASSGAAARFGAAAEDAGAAAGRPAGDPGLDGGADDDTVPGRAPHPGAASGQDTSAAAGPRPAAGTGPGRRGTGSGPGPDDPDPAAPAGGTEVTAAPGTPGGRPGDTGKTGAGPWVRCFTEEYRAAQPPPADEISGPWRLRVAPEPPFGTKKTSVFRDDPDAGTVLAIIGDPAEPGACGTLLTAAREAQQTGRLVVISSGGAVAGFCASLHAERPGMGVTLVRTALTPKGLLAARRYAAASPGRFREVILSETGAATEPVMRLTEPAADGTFPLGPADVVMVSGITEAGDLACATALVSRGAALAVVAAPGPDDPRLTAVLAELRAAGARVGRKKADLTDPGQVAAAVRSLERGLGPVTAVVHAPAAAPVQRCARLPEPALRSYLAGQRTRLANVLNAVAPERLRMLITFGSVAARYGSAGRGCEALASGLLAEHASGLVAGHPRCRALHVDWAPWDGPAGAAGRGGDAVPISVAEAAQLLLDMLTTSDPPPRVAVHGRLGPTARPSRRTAAARPMQKGRFLGTVCEYYPGVELVTDTRVSLLADPYLADYRIDGLAVLPAAMALEAMAQAASALAGQPLRQAADVCLTAPVILPAGPEDGQAMIRVCALSRGGEVETVLRCAETRFQVDHARAVFRAVGGAAGTGAGLDAGTPAAGEVSPGGIVDGTDLYGPVFFQSGRFRRVAFLPEVSSRGCRALVRGGDASPWFGPLPGPVDVPLILGSPGLNDATLHVLQACLPHRRLLPGGCESATFSGHEVRGALQVQARRRHPDGTAPDSTAQGSMAPGGGTAGDVWDVVAVDATGRPAVSWSGLRLRDVGPLAQTAAWHPVLLANALEARAAELGVDATLRAVISTAPSPFAGRAPQAAPALAGPERAEPEPAGPRHQGTGQPAPGDPGPVRQPPRMAGQGGAVPGNSPDTPGHVWSDRAPGRGPLDGFELRVTAAGPVACCWEAAGAPPGEQSPLDEGLLRLRQELEDRSHEIPAARQSRFRTITSCLAALGREPGTSCTLEDGWDGGWIVVRASGVTVACTVTGIAGVPAPVSVAIAAGPAPAGRPGPARGRASRDEGRAVTANGSRP